MIVVEKLQQLLSCVEKVVGCMDQLEDVLKGAKKEFDSHQIVRGLARKVHQVLGMSEELNRKVKDTLSQLDESVNYQACLKALSELTAHCQELSLYTHNNLTKFEVVDDLWDVYDKDDEFYPVYNRIKQDLDKLGDLLVELDVSVKECWSGLAESVAMGWNSQTGAEETRDVQESSGGSRQELIRQEISEAGNLVAEAILSSSGVSQQSGKRDQKGSSNLSQQIDNSIRNLLGTDIKPRDSSKTELDRFSKSLKLNLNKNVRKTKRPDGKELFKIDKTLGIKSSSGLHQLTGSQASLYRFTREVNESVTQIIDQLVSESTDSDDDTVNFLKNEIKSDMASIESEMKRTGGPVFQRIEAAISTINVNLQSLSSELSIGGSQGNKELGIAKREENNKNFAIVVSYIQRLETRVKDIKFSKGAKISELLLVVKSLPESVSQASFEMSASGFEQVDRDAFRDVSDVFEWITSSAQDDWYPRLADGDVRPAEIEKIRINARKIRQYIDKLLRGSDDISKYIRVGSLKVKRALLELEAKLKRIEKLSDDIYPQQKLERLESIGIAETI